MSPNDRKDMNTFDRLTRGQDIEGGRRTVVDETWAQGRSAFGGLSTAFGFRHCVNVAAMPPRMVTARLWAPIPPGPLTSKVDVLHAGKSVRILRSSLSVPAKTVGEVDVVFGAPRASAIVIPAPEYPEGAVESAFPLPASGPHLPAFLQHMEVRWLEGQPPFTGGSTPVIGGFCRHRDGEGGLSEMIGLLDCWPSPALSLSKRPIAASTVQWTIHFTQPDPVHSDWYRFLSTALTSNEGYVSMRGDLWGDSGQHIAWMEQLVAVYG